MSEKESGPRALPEDSLVLDACESTIARMTTRSGGRWVIPPPPLKLRLREMRKCGRAEEIAGYNRIMVNHLQRRYMASR